jgi:hypothetical protein
MPREKHHIVPICMGGDNSSENLIELSPTSHAIIGVLQSEHYGRMCFHRAQMPLLPPELLPIAEKWSRLQNQEARESALDRIRNQPDVKARWKSNLSASMKQWWSEADNYLRQVEHCRRNRPSQKGHRNSQYGTMWITNGEISKPIKRGDPIPEGYIAGRKWNLPT